MARQLLLTAFAYSLGLLAVVSPFVMALEKTDTLYAEKKLHALHTSGGLTVSQNYVYAGTDTGTVEKRDFEGALIVAFGDYKTASATRTFNSSTNRLGGFTALDPYATDDVFYFCSEDQNGIFRYNTADDSMTRIVGDDLGQAGVIQSGQTLRGTGAHLNCGLMAAGFARSDNRDRIYAVTGKGLLPQYAIVTLTATAATAADDGSLSFLLGTGLNAHADGSGTDAAVFDVTQMIFYRSPVNVEYLIIAGQDPNGPFRYMNLGTGQLKTTAIPYSSNSNVSGTGNDARSPYPTGLVRVPGRAMAYGCAENVAFTLSWETDLSNFHIEFHKGDVTPRRGAALAVSMPYVFFGNGQTGPNEFIRFNYSTTPSNDAPGAPGAPSYAPAPSTGAASGTPVALETKAATEGDGEIGAACPTTVATALSFAAVLTLALH